METKYQLQQICIKILTTRKYQKQKRKLQMPRTHKHIHTHIHSLTYIVKLGQSVARIIKYKQKIIIIQQKKAENTKYTLTHTHIHKAYFSIINTYTHIQNCKRKHAAFISVIMNNVCSLCEVFKQTHQHL